MCPDNPYLEKLKSLGFVGMSKIGHKVSSEDVVVLAGGKDTPMGRIASDKIMFKTITKGNASDKSLNRDTAAIETERLQRKKENNREEKSSRIREMKKRYKAKYGCDT